MPAANSTPSVMFVPAGSHAGLPGLVQVAGRPVYTPILEPDGVLIVDTGRNVLDLQPCEIPVLRAVLAALDALPLTLSG